MRLLLIAATFILIASNASICGAEDVEVTYKDGKKDHGEWVDANADKVTLKIKLGNNSVDLQIPWARIEKLSNGLTRETALKKWKEAHKDKLCDTCGGDRQIACDKCKATGLLAKLMIDCKACKGTGTAACTAKGCVAGKVPCPEPCLKLSEGKWEKGDENLMWRKFVYKGGWKSWSERHLGEVIEMQDGVPQNIGKCKVCGGTQTADCKICKGTGKAECAACKGAKQVPEPGSAKKCPDCAAGKLNCPACKGTGLKP